MAGEQIVVGVDAGTTKVCTVIAEVRGPDQLQVVGVGVAPSHGLKRGLVVDMQEAANAVSVSLKKAEAFSGYKIMGALVALSGAHLDSELVYGTHFLSGARPATREDLAAVLAAAKPTDVQEGRQVLHVIPRSYALDGQNGIKNPTGMYVSRLDVEGLVVTSASNPVQNMGNCVERAGAEIDGFVSAGLASADGVLTETEKELGVLLMDVGAGMTDLACFRDGVPQFVAALPFGGSHISNDISLCVGLPLNVAEEVKINYAAALPGLISSEETIALGADSDLDGQSVARRLIAEIVEARLAELFALAAQELERRGLGKVLPGGAVLTGGTAQMRGVRELAQQVLGMSVRIGSPVGLTGAADSIATPPYATAAGLLRWAVSQPTDAIGSRSIKRGVGFGTRLRGLVRAFLP